MELLAKAIEPDHMRAVANSTAKGAMDLVDYKAQFDALSSGPVAKHVEHYKEAMNHPAMRPERFHNFADGITPKQVFAHGLKKYIVKPYFETPSSEVSAFAKFPIAGWAELTNQELYHAVGLGAFHQTVTGHLHPGWKDMLPAIAIHAADGHTTFRERGAYQLKGDTNPMFSDVMRKVNVLDFLTNNLDRHAENMLSSDEGYGLAIDHGLSFQYTSNMKDKWDTTKSGRDTIGAYINRKYSAGQALLGPHDAIAMPLKASPYVQVMKWWGNNSSKAKMAIKNQLKFVKDKKLKDHIWKNFKARAELLDSWAEFGLENFGAGAGGASEWLNHVVPIHPHPDYKHLYPNGGLR